MPIGMEVLGTQAADRSLGQILILKTAPGQHHALFADSSGNRHKSFHESIMKLRSDQSLAPAAVEVFKNCPNQPFCTYRLE